MGEGLKFVYIGNVPGSKASNTYCPECGKLLVERLGYTITRNHVVNGKCEFCEEKIAGVWE
jgi:pyruvate formate lyase activating enzyme